MDSSLVTDRKWMDVVWVCTFMNLPLARHISWVKSKTVRQPRKVVVRSASAVQLCAASLHILHYDSETRKYKRCLVKKVKQGFSIKILFNWLPLRKFLQEQVREANCCLAVMEKERKMLELNWRELEDERGRKIESQLTKEQRTQSDQGSGGSRRWKAALRRCFWKKPSWRSALSMVHYKKSDNITLSVLKKR